jgi:hypothetical protein
MVDIYSLTIFSSIRMELDIEVMGITKKLEYNIRSRSGYITS